MVLKKIFLVFITLSIFLFSQVNADNKSDLISRINTLESNLNSLKTNSISSLEWKVQELLDNYNNAFINLWYDEKKVSYLFSLWKITSNFKDDLVKELSDLKWEILSKINLELSSLLSIKDDINFKYQTISDNEKAIFDLKLDSISSNYNSLRDTFSQKEVLLNSKYTSSLDNYIENIKKLYLENTSDLDLVSNFNTKYEELYSLFLDFEKNYNSFKSTFLSYAWDLTIFSETKQKEYVASLRESLEKIRDLNFESNKSLEKHKLDINRFIDILVENFENSLFLKIVDSYWVIYSWEDLNNLMIRFESVKNRYFDNDWKIKAKVVIENKWAIEELDFLKEKINEINIKIKYLIWENDNSNTIENIKIRLENEMIRFYNSTYTKYKEDLMLKLKEKLDIRALESKNILLASDTISLRFSLLSDKINKLNDLHTINKEIANFKKDIAKYSYLNSESLNKKIKNIERNLEIFVIEKEIAEIKYKKFSQNREKYKEQLQKFFSLFKSKYSSNYEEKLNSLIRKIDTLLQENNKDKKRHMLLVLKLETLKFLQD